MLVKIVLITTVFSMVEILKGSDKFSQSYDHYKILCKLASGHALTSMSVLSQNFIRGIRSNKLLKTRQFNLTTVVQAAVAGRN